MIVLLLTITILTVCEKYVFCINYLATYYSLACDGKMLQTLLTIKHLREIYRSQMKYLTQIKNKFVT